MMDAMDRDEEVPAGVPVWGSGDEVSVGIERARCELRTKRLDTCTIKVAHHTYILLTVPLHIIGTIHSLAPTLVSGTRPAFTYK